MIWIAVPKQQSHESLTKAAIISKPALKPDFKVKAASINQTWPSDLHGEWIDEHLIASFRVVEYRTGKCLPAGDNVGTSPRRFRIMSLSALLFIKSI
jgi:hypothetical protein